MSLDSDTNDNETILAAAFSAILGKEILPESNVPQQTQQHINKISIFDQHLTCFIYGKVGKQDTNKDESFMTIYITILTTKTTFPCTIECDASVDKLKQIIYEKEGILRNKQNLIYCGQEIDEGHLLSEYDIQESSEITVVRLRAMNSDDLLVLDKAALDSSYDFDFTNINDNGKRFTRGGIEYHRPCGWKRYAIKVTGKYENGIWLGSNNSPDEWPVSYHGTKHDAVNSIAQIGYDLTKHQRFAHGRGIYSTPDVNIAKGFAKSFTKDGQQYLVILQNRVNPKNLIKLSHEETGNGEYWISPNAADIRPYGVCIMKKS
ncbi:unnamed protein product [Rotaria sordida]|uniref:Ubiquitin-like domain-containing protein n=1 Tax=Rotaria sordida TaxID=392033 RepID=A0A818MN73_9BILA|nr:unnamed protein product [Rotaria sordida]CAF3591684.1 unnamed protein product [Rotaria sordida]